MDHGRDSLQMLFDLRRTALDFSDLKTLLQPRGPLPDRPGWSSRPLGSSPPIAHGHSAVDQHAILGGWP